MERRRGEAGSEVELGGDVSSLCLLLVVVVVVVVFEMSSSRRRDLIVARRGFDRLMQELGWRVGSSVKTGRFGGVVVGMVRWYLWWAWAWGL